jgi:hypothetical protein
MLLLISAALATSWTSTTSSDVCTAGGGPGYIVPLASEDGFYLLHRFGPFTSAASISRFSFLMAGDSHGDAVCDSLLDGDLAIWASSSSTPPTALPTWRIALTPVRYGTGTFSSSDDQTVTTWLASPLSVAAGQYVYVAMEELHDGSSATCYQTCKDGKSSTSSYYSDTDAAPFGWDKLSAYGISYDTAKITLYGP